MYEKSIIFSANCEQAKMLDGGGVYATINMKIKEMLISKNIKKILICIVFVISCQLLFIVTNTYALDYEEVTEDYVIPKDYAFTPKFIDGITTVETSSAYNNSSIISNTLSNTSGYEMHYIIDSTNYNDIYVIYKNVGTYQGKIIDLKITL